ncbi:MAG TPA: DUF2378 family protein [Archangium sp.]|nr:DUF2378 family protein [Archangium sp.]
MRGTLASSRTRGSGDPHRHEDPCRYPGHATARLASASGMLMMTLVQQNPRRLFNSLRVSLQVVATSTAQITTRMTRPASGIITHKHDLLSRPNMEGGLLALFLPANVRGEKVRTWATGPLDSEYEISWE